MKKRYENLIIIFLFFILLMQGYLLFIKNPKSVREQPATPPPPSMSVPSTPSYPTNQNTPPAVATPSFPPGGTGATFNTPPPSSPGTGSVPGIPTANTPLPVSPTPPTALTPAATPASPPPMVMDRGPTDPYRDLAIGIMILEKDEKLALSKDQAKEFLAIFQEVEDLKDAVPDAQKLIEQNLTKKQLEYVEKKKKDKKNQGPEEKFDQYAKKVTKLLEEKARL